MAFGSGGTYGFNSNNSTTPNFAGFGTNNNNSASGFGSNSSGNTFGSSTAGNNPFGSGGTSFGSGTAGFGSSTNNSASIFGSKPPPASNPNPFGSNNANTGSLFGGANNNATGGGFGNTTSGFGANNATTNATNAFGAGANSSFSGFGAQNKPLFGTNTASTPLFGQGGSGTTNTFGTGAFGSGGSGTALNSGPVPPSNGTNDIPFAPVVEKDGNTTINFQSINVMPAYAKYSFEELRVGDYTAGRRFGNGTTGPSGAFGFSSSFGQNNATTGFSGTNNPFGATATTSGGFGNNTATAFGSGASNLFGPKPAATSSLFNQAAVTPATTGSLFGSSTASANNPFAPSLGSNNTNNTGGGMFGNNHQNQTKSLFGNTNLTANTGSGLNFGANASTTGNTGGIFGTNNQQQQQPGGIFATSNQNQQKPSLFGGSTGFGISTTQNQSTGGIFGPSNSTTTGGSLFPNTTANATGGGMFGGNTTQQANTGGGLFGNNNTANKPGSLFNSSTFGNNNNQQGGSGMFGSNNANMQQAGGLFNNANNNSTSTAFSFGNQNKPTTSIFGNTSTNQSGGLFTSGSNNGNSMFGNSQSNQQQNQQQQEQFKYASLLDPNPYGQSSIWTGLPQPNLENSKPLITPLTATQKLRESQAKPPPSLRLNQSRYMTSPKRNGFGFSYSTYGTPNSAASTPGGNGLSNSMYSSRFTGGSFGRSIGKAASVNSLRTQYLDGESVLSPGAFAPSASRYSSGSIRRLTIDKSIRNDLFTRPTVPALLGDRAITNGTASQPSSSSSRNDLIPEIGTKLKKRVSFDKDITRGTGDTLTGHTGALVRTESDDEITIDDSRPAPSNGVHKSNDLAAVPEDRESDATFSRKKNGDAVKPDPQPGDYWMKPTRAELRQMPREKLQHFRNFEVGRVGCGKVLFNEPVDLTSISLDDLFETIIEIRLRSVTVYPDGVKKPELGDGLNVPSTISIENSWPRNRGQVSSITTGPAFEKHINRLKKIPGTTFVSYEPETGIWTFKVPHYTRYGLDYDDEDDEDFDESPLSDPPVSLQQLKSAGASVMEVDSDEYDSSGQDDTFALQSQRQKSIPGGFGTQIIIDSDIEDGAVIRAPEQDDRSEHSHAPEDEVTDDGMDMAGSFPAPTGPVLNFGSPVRPILNPGIHGTPGHALLDLEGDWAEQLQRTISPRKQNRDVLREAQSKVLLDRAYEPIQPAVRKAEFRSSIDVMNSIFGNQGRTKGGREAKPDFEFPYTKRAKLFDQGAEDMTDTDKAWHASFKPSFTTRNQLVCKTAKVSTSTEWTAEVLASGGARNISISSLREQETLNIPPLLDNASISLAHDVPQLEYMPLPFSALKEKVPLAKLQSKEGTVYELLHVLFDKFEDEFSYDLSDQQREEYEHRIRKDRLSKFLTTVLTLQAYPLSNVGDAAGAAFQHLTAHSIREACETLMKARDFNLAILVSQLETADSAFQGDMADQIMAWKDQNIISEMTEEVRSLYELLSGNTTICQGNPNGPAEDRASTFRLSKKYDLSWLQAFALCFWYGHSKMDNVEDIVEDFAQKITTGEESATPINADGQEDPMWVMLRLFAVWHRKSAATIPEFPADISALSKPFDVSSTFSLLHAISRGLQDGTARITPALADQLAADYAFQLEAKGDFVGAIWALTHLKNATKRGGMMFDLLCRHAEYLDAPFNELETNPQWVTLTQTLKVPKSWIYQAKAFYYRSINSRYEELHYLVLAKDWAEAHDCLCRRVAPRLVIDEDYDMLRGVISTFGEKPDGTVEGWNRGGRIYSDLVAVVDKGSGASLPAKKAAFARLQNSLADMGARLALKGSTDIAAGGLEPLEERVAVKEMSKLVAGLLQDDAASAKELLELPLAAEVKSGLAGRMAAEYYRKVMSGGR